MIGVHKIRLTRPLQQVQTWFVFFVVWITLLPLIWLTPLPVLFLSLLICHCGRTDSLPFSSKNVRIINIAKACRNNKDYQRSSIPTFGTKRKQVVPLELLEEPIKGVDVGSLNGGGDVTGATPAMLAVRRTSPWKEIRLLKPAIRKKNNMHSIWLSLCICLRRCKSCINTS